MSDSIDKNQKQSEDFYFEDGLLVMTEHFHLKRGYCCGSKCKHCPFDHINVVIKQTGDKAT
jgi:hypothetical protein